MKFKPALLHFKFDNFASIPSEFNVYAEEQTDCNGHKWRLALYPGGDPLNEEPGWISLFLHSGNINEGELEVKFTITVKDANGTPAKEHKCKWKFANEFVGGGTGQAMERSVILDATNNILTNGALCVEVGIQVKDARDYLFQPPNCHCRKMLALLRSEENADASFTVGDRCFQVHSLIINANSPILANSINGTISSVHPNAFRLLLEYIYSGRVPTDKQIVKHGKDLIDITNRYEIIGLKMFVENGLVRQRIMTKENVADYILFADAQSCPLLREYAISFFSVHHREVLKSEHSKKLKESGELLSEIMLLMNIGMQDANSDSMTINELRKELGKRKLDVDGSKDALMARLEDAKRQRTE